MAQPEPTWLADEAPARDGAALVEEEHSTVGRCERWLGLAVTGGRQGAASTRRRSGFLDTPCGAWFTALMAVIERKAVALAVGSAAFVLTTTILLVSLLGSSAAPALVIVVGPSFSVAYGLQRRLFPTADRLFERTLEGTLFGGGAGLFAALAADQALEGAWGSALADGAICLFGLCVWGLRVWRIRTGRISYDCDKLQLREVTHGRHSRERRSPLRLPPS